MKKMVSLILTALMLCSLCCVTAFAAEENAAVYVTISDAEGKLVLTQEPVTVTDVDGDGALTINDALYAAHEAKYEGGAAVGYGSAMGDYGLYITILWGVEEESYGYYVNHASAWNLADPVQTGDYVNVFVYTDLVTWSDTYCFFGMNTASAVEGEAVELTLSAAGYDEVWNPITIPVEGAVITVDGAATGYMTDAEGKVTVKLEEGTHIISAASETMTLVPPVCKVTVTAAAEAPDDDAVPPTAVPDEEIPATGDSIISNSALALLCLCSAAGLVVLSVQERKQRG